MYALGIGFQKDPMNASHFNFTYENADEFQSFPTIAVVMGHRGDLADLKVPGVPDFNPLMILHGEEKVEMYSPIEQDTTVVVHETIVDLQDKKKATVMVIQADIIQKDTNELKAKLYTTLFIRGIGGFGGHKGFYKNDIPSKFEPSHEVEFKTEPN